MFVYPASCNAITVDKSNLAWVSELLKAHEYHLHFCPIPASAALMNGYAICTLVHITVRDVVANLCLPCVYSLCLLLLFINRVLYQALERKKSWNDKVPPYPLPPPLPHYHVHVYTI